MFKKKGKTFSLLGLEFGDLKVIAYLGRGRGHRLWLAVCSRWCNGNERVCKTQDLTGGQVLACDSCTALYRSANLRLAARVRRERALANG